jgi:DNA-binding transcriptional regulator YiaG
VREETVHLWETGRARPLARAYCRIVRFLGYDPEEEPGTLAGRLRSLRRRLGLTQRDLAVRLGLDEGTVVDLESRRRRVSRRVLAVASAFLDWHGSSSWAGRHAPRRHDEPDSRQRW